MKKGFIRALLALAFVATVPATSLAQDQESGEVSASSSSFGSGSGSSRGPLRLYGGLHLGGGGHAKNRNSGGGKEGMGFLVGFQLGADYILHKYFAIGGEYRLTSSSFDTGGFAGRSPDRPLFIDFDVKPRARYELSNIPLEVYGTLPVGLSVVAPHNHLDTKANANLGLGAGATYFFNDKMGINSEIQGIFHWYHNSQTFGGGAGIPGETVTIKERFGQFYWFTNFVYVL